MCSLSEKNMKRNRLLIIASLSLLVLSGCDFDNSLSEESQTSTTESINSESTSISQDDIIDVRVGNKYRTFYQLLIYSFADSNGNGIGDFKGIANRIPYLKGLGINGLWLSPANESSSYHSYDVTDYYSIKSIYEVDGYTFEHFLDDCTAADIAVIMDLVINHSGSQHPWFIQGVQAFINNSGSKYKEYYNFSHSWSNKHSHQIDGIYYEGIFWSGMPDLNFDSQHVRQEIINIGKHWLNKGVAGFRLDAAMHIFTNYNGGSVWENDNYDKNIAWWREFQGALSQDYPDVYLIGEMWTDESKIESYYAGNLDSNFNFDARNRISSALNGQGEFSNWLANHQSSIRHYNPNGIEAYFLSNHDMSRFTEWYSDSDKLKMAAAMQILAPGNAFVYYGDEIGLTGHGHGGDAVYRTPMLWGSSDMTRPADYGLNNNYYSQTISGQNAVEQTTNLNSLYSYYRSVINLKNMYPELYGGTITSINTTHNHRHAYQIEQDDVYLLVVHNTDSQEATLSLTQSNVQLGGFVSINQTPVRLTSGTLVMPGLSSSIIVGAQPISISI
jgi:alpha-amylase